MKPQERSLSPVTAPEVQVLCPKWPDYALLDSGNGEKLERFGSRTLRRGEPKAWWSPRLPRAAWEGADARHEDASGLWTCKSRTARQAWQMQLGSVTLELKLTDNSKHVGVFPEQEPHWSRVASAARRKGVSEGNARLLNLFGYTGAASLVAAAAGYHVTHVDASKPAIDWGRRSQQLSGLEALPIRWVLEDAVRYCQREIRRGNRYEAILLDPPSFGRGPKKELWKVEKDLPQLLDLCGKLLSKEAHLMILTCYSVEASALSMWNLLRTVAPRKCGQVQCGELVTPEEGSGRFLPLSLWASWSP